MTEDLEPLHLTVNGVDYDLQVSPDAKLADVLRRSLGLTGTKIGCGEGQCGACVVWIDGRPRRSCTYPARRAASKQIVTIEGLAASWGDPDELHPLQKAFIEHGAIQCGFCSPGMLLSATALLRANPHPGEAEVRQAISGNLCRCTGYQNIVEAVQLAAERASP